MNTRHIRFYIAMALMIVAIYGSANAFAAHPLFDEHDKELIDETAATLEKQNNEGKPQAAPLQFSSLIAGKALGVIAELYIDSSPRASSLKPEQREYYRNHPEEFRAPIFKSEFGESRLRRFNQIFASRLTSKDRRIRKEAVWWLTTMSADKASMDQVRSLLVSTDTETRHDVAVQLAQLKDRSGEAILEKSLDDKYQFRSLEAARALVALGNEKGKKRLFEMLRSTQNASVDVLNKAQALSGLASVREPRVDKEIQEQLFSPYPAIVNAAVGGLQLREDAPLEERTAARLFEILDDPHYGASGDSIKSTAWDVLLAKPKSEWRDRFLQYKNSSDPGMRVGMIRGLMIVGSKKDVGLIIGFLDDSNRQVRMQAEYGLRRITGISFGSIENDLDGVIANRKDWWKKNANDHAYQP